MQRIWSHFFLGCRWINNQRKLNSVWHNMPHWKIIVLICCARRSPKVTLITVFVSIICGVKTSMVTPSFYYVFNISLSCNINIPSFIGNLWWVLLLGNHRNVIFWTLSSSWWRVCSLCDRMRRKTPLSSFCSLIVMYCDSFVSGMTVTG